MEANAVTGVTGGKSLKNQGLHNTSWEAGGPHKPSTITHTRKATRPRK